ncbi:50S ribosomal protein L23 [Marininema halotolerans]|uniref:Large ribosomal subunit protein uL23 n=1 Tax=Marininema halotolerans TaxID=1155944 RepID=A0A1I6T630_9BACL|nr:50S ribosomal protein L23 [Marininema halotolerans]SFS84666.1 large subunit ribosomal protein L23 [Marininema halotolerans]
MSRDPRDIIRRPIVTEKTTDLMEQNKYAFEVDLKANKSEIKRAIESIFGVKVDQVSTMRVKGKPKRFGRHTGRSSDRKKAIVKLTEDSKGIEIFEG